QKTVLCALFDPEQQVQIGRQRCRFACLVQAVDNVQVRGAGNMLPEINRIVGEFAVASEIEPAQTHQLISVASGFRRASMSSLPSVSSWSTRASNAASSSPVKPRASGGRSSRSS